MVEAAAAALLADTGDPGMGATVETGAGAGSKGMAAVVGDGAKLRLGNLLLPAPCHSKIAR